jgi:uncharacterized protein YndB with AHSA1/START domain
MTERSVIHDTFNIQRTYQATPARVFAAFADPQAKARWMDSPDATPTDDAVSDDFLEFDFRVGGHERFGFKMPDGRTFSYDAVYYDIVPDQRIVYVYQMHADDAPDSVSLVTIEFGKADAGTALIYTEQGAFLDGIDLPAERLEGQTELLDNLTGYLAAQAAG